MNTCIDQVSAKTGPIASRANPYLLAVFQNILLIQLKKLNEMATIKKIEVMRNSANFSRLKLLNRHFEYLAGSFLWCCLAYRIGKENQRLYSGSNFDWRYRFENRLIL